MKLKDRLVNITGLHSSFWPRLFKIDEFWREHFGYELVITSGNDDAHILDSKHYSGDAIDMRTWINSYTGDQLVGSTRRHALRSVADYMGSNFIVINEEDHFHIQRSG